MQPELEDAMRKRLFFARRCLLAISLLGFMAASEPVWATGKPAVRYDIEKCDKATSPDVAIAYCTQAIESRQFRGKLLAFAFYKRGNAYYGKGDHDRAISDYNQAIRLNPSDVNSRSNRGAAYARKRDYDRAIEDYDEAIRLNPNNADAFSNRGVAYARKGDYDRAIQDYDEAARLNPNHANALYGRGNAYRRKGDYDRAIQNYDEAIRLSPNHANAFSNRGIAYSHKRDYARAIQSYDEAIRLNPNYVNAFYNRGNAYRRNGDYQRAVLDYDQVIRLNPKHVNAYSNRGLARFYQGQFAAAAPDFSKALEFTPTNLYRILLLYMAQARAGSDARDSLEQATKGLDLTVWPGPIVSMYLGKITEEVVFDAVADADPNRERQKRCQAYFYVGQWLLMRQKNRDAAEMFQQTVATNASTLFEYEGARIELEHLGN
jgi:tetratricopeptide (TPR) repeat protein